MNRTLTALALLAIVAACARKEQPSPAADAAPPAAAPAPAMLAISDLTGTWAMETRKEGSDSVLVRFTLTAGADTSGWSLTFDGRPPVPTRVLSVDGDSITTEAGPYASAVRKGVQVVTRTVMRKQGDKLMGRTLATYSKGPDSVLVLLTEGTRK